MKSIQINRRMCATFIGFSLFCSNAFAQNELIFEHPQIDKVYTLKKAIILKSDTAVI